MNPDRQATGSPPSSRRRSRRRLASLPAAVRVCRGRTCGRFRPSRRRRHRPLPDPRGRGGPKRGAPWSCRESCPSRGNRASSSWCASMSPPVFVMTPQSAERTRGSSGQRRYVSAASSAAVSRSLSSSESDVATSASTRAFSAARLGLAAPHRGESASDDRCDQQHARTRDRPPQPAVVPLVAGGALGEFADLVPLPFGGRIEELAFHLGEVRLRPVSPIQRRLQAGTAQEVLVAGDPTAFHSSAAVATVATSRAPSASSSSQRSRRGHAVARASWATVTSSPSVVRRRAATRRSRTLRRAGSATSGAREAVRRTEAPSAPRCTRRSRSERHASASCVVEGAVQRFGRLGDRAGDAARCLVARDGQRRSFSSDPGLHQSVRNMRKRRAPVGGIPHDQLDQPGLEPQACSRRRGARSPHADHRRPTGRWHTRRGRSERRCGAGPPRGRGSRCATSSSRPRRRRAPPRALRRVRRAPGRQAGRIASAWSTTTISAPPLCSTAAAEFDRAIPARRHHRDASPPQRRGAALRPARARICPIRKRPTTTVIEPASTRRTDRLDVGVACRRSPRRPTA